MGGGYLFVKFLVTKTLLEVWDLHLICRRVGLSARIDRWILICYEALPGMCFVAVCGPRQETSSEHVCIPAQIELSGNLREFRCASVGISSKICSGGT